MDKKLNKKIIQKEKENLQDFIVTSTFDDNEKTFEELLEEILAVINIEQKEV